MVTTSGMVALACALTVASSFGISGAGPQKSLNLETVIRKVTVYASKRPDFAGVWVVGDQVHAAFTREVRVHAASLRQRFGDHVVVEHFPFSFRQLKSLQSRIVSDFMALRQIGVELAAVGIRDNVNKVGVWLATPATEDVVALLTRRYGGERIEVKFSGSFGAMADPRYAGPPWVGGMGLSGVCQSTDCVASGCTSGFTAWRLISGTKFHFQVTAGHCFRTQSAVTHAVRYTVGNVITNAFHNLSNADAEDILQSPTTVSSKIVVISNPATVVPVIGAANPSVGQSYCKSGVTTGQTCGWSVSSTSAVVMIRTGTSVVQLVDQAISSRTIYGVDHGDSGGPVYKYADANNGQVVGYGLVSATNVDEHGDVIGTVLVFTKILNALSALNLNSLSTLSAP